MVIHGRPRVLDAQSDIKIQGEVLHQDPFQVDVVKELIKSESRETKRRHCIDVAGLWNSAPSLLR